MSKSHGMPHVLVGYYLSDLRGFAAVNGLDDKNDGEVRAPRARSFQKLKRAAQGLWRDCCSVSAVLCDQPRPQNVASFQDLFDRSHDNFYRPGVSRRNDLETVFAFWAAPKMNNLPLIPMSRPFGGNQFITALNARHREFWTPIRYHPHYKSLLCS